MLCASRHFQPGEGRSRGLLRDCTTGCGTDGSFYSTSVEHVHDMALMCDVTTSSTSDEGGFQAPSSSICVVLMVFKLEDI